MEPIRPNGLNRRQFLAATIAAAIAASCGGDDDDGPTTTTGGESTTSSEAATTSAAPTTTAVTAAVELPGDPFTLGVASGDPTDSAVILWTRLAPDPTDGGGMPDTDVAVTWEVATDEAFTDVVAEGEALALAALGHSVHVDATGLEPDSIYHYRFTVGDYASPVGRTRTFGAPGTVPERFRFAFSSCQNWQGGQFAAWRDVAALADLDAVIFLGDYIYEYADGEYDNGLGRSLEGAGECITLDDYRNRYALYQTDTHLQAAHAAAPWLITWDDHEVDNNYADDISEENAPTDEFLARRAAGYQAWYEHLPVRLDPPTGPDWPIYRSTAHGDLVRFYVLDTRQYRSDQPTDGEPLALPGLDDEVRQQAEQALDPSRTMLGDEQESWLIEEATASTAAWNCLAQQVFMFGANALAPQDPPWVVVDTWDGYAAARQRLLDALSAGPRPTNLVVITGDFHSAAVGDLRTDPFDQSLPVVGTEFMAAAISSQFFEGAEDLVAVALPANPQIRFFDLRNGYTVCDITPEAWVSEYRVVLDVADPDSAVEPIATFAVTAGTPGAIQQS